MNGERESKTINVYKGSSKRFLNMMWKRWPCFKLPHSTCRATAFVFQIQEPRVCTQSVSLWSRLEFQTLSLAGDQQPEEQQTAKDGSRLPPWAIMFLFLESDVRKWRSRIFAWRRFRATICFQISPRVELRSWRATLGDDC